MKPTELTTIESFKFLWKYAAKYKLNFILFYLGWFVESFLEALSPILLALMIDEVVYYQNFTFFYKISLVFVASSIFACILYFNLYTIHSYLMSMYTFDIKQAIYKHALNARATYMADVKTGDIMQIIENDGVACMHIIIRNLFHFLNGVLKTAFYFFFVYYIDWRLGLLMTFTLPIILVINRVSGKRMRQQCAKLRDMEGLYTSWIFEVIKGLREIKLLAAEKTVLTSFIHKFKDMTGIKIKTSVLDFKTSKLVDGAQLAVQLSMYVLSAHLIIRGQLTLGVFFAVVEFYSRTNHQMKYLSENNMDMQSHLASVARIHRFLSTETEQSWSGKNPLRVTKGHIDLSHICFSYNQDSHVLKNLSLSIEGGSHVAVVGISGSGKSTLSSLLLGFYSPDSGKITIDGLDVSECTLETLRKSIGLVSQEVLIFEDTLRANLKMGKASATDDELLAACDHAAIGDFIRKLPMGLNTVIGREGINLSGGQKQRLSIARIYLKNPKILIFDEATSSLDNETEELVLDSWDKLSSGRTTLTIAHRLSTIVKSDKVALLREGRIEAFGHHHDLLKNCTHYREMLENQIQEEIAC